jgi:hypothetical protein
MGRRSQRGVRGSQGTTARYGGMVEVLLQKMEHTGRRSQRGRCEDKYQYHGTFIQHQPSTQHQPCPEQLTIYSSSSGGSGNSSSSIFFI